ncbi:MAG: PKD domain-containing protein, partial [Candidatus Bathyarchaeia archaeon]
RIIDSKTGENSVILGNESTPIPLGGYSFTVNVTLTGLTQNIVTFQVAISFEYSKVKCTGAWLPTNNPNFVFYNKKIQQVQPEIYNQQPRKAPPGYGYVFLGASLLNWNDAVTTSQAILCQINFTAIKIGTFTLSIIPTGSPDYDDDSFLWNSDSIEIPFTSESFQVTVYGAKSPPIAAFTWQPQYPKPNQPVTFDASGSYDPDGYIANYTWDFGDGTNTTTNQQSVNHTYTTYGIKYVNLTVTDNENQNSSKTQVIFVGIPPQISFTYDPENPYVPIGANATITLNATGSFDPDGTITQYLWNLTRLQFKPKGVKINYVPVEFWNETTTDENVTFTLSKNSLYNVTLTAFDNDGLYNSTSKIIFVGQRPIVNFTWTPLQPMPDQEVIFNAYGTETERYTYDEDGEIVYAIWDFYGEMEETQMQAYNITKPTELVATFTYTGQGGDYTVTLIVFDDEGLYSSISHDIHVTVIQAQSESGTGWELYAAIAFFGALGVTVVWYKKRPEKEPSPKERYRVI